MYSEYFHKSVRKGEEEKRHRCDFRRIPVSASLPGELLDLGWSHPEGLTSLPSASRVVLISLEKFSEKECRCMTLAANTCGSQLQLQGQLKEIWAGLQQHLIHLPSV
jgi:hypothetical protein